MTLTPARAALLRRLAEAGGGLFKYQIESDLVGLILEMEREGLVERHFRQYAAGGQKMLKVSITAAGRAALAAHNDGGRDAI